MKGIKVNKTWLEKGQARLYVKRPIPIMARQIDETFWVTTLEGDMQAREGDYLISGIRGELYSCDRDVFEASYDLLNPKCPHTKTVALNEEGNAGVYCSDCGTKISDEV